LVLGGVEPVPQGFPGQRHLERAPGALAGPAQGPRQPLAAIAEAVAEGYHQVVGALAEGLAKCEARKRLEDAHEMVLPPVPPLSDGPEKCLTAAEPPVVPNSHEIHGNTAGRLFQVSRGGLPS